MISHILLGWRSSLQYNGEYHLQLVFRPDSHWGVFLSYSLPWWEVVPTTQILHSGIGTHSSCLNVMNKGMRFQISTIAISWPLPIVTHLNVIFWKTWMSNAPTKEGCAYTIENWGTAFHINQSYVVNTSISTDRSEQDLIENLKLIFYYKII